MHCPGRGQSLGSQQLHFEGVASVFWFNILKLCLDIADLKLGKQRYDSFTFFLLSSGCKGDPGGKCMSNNLRNFAPILVFTFMEYGGLKYILFLVLLPSSVPVQF